MTSSSPHANDRADREIAASQRSTSPSVVPTTCDGRVDWGEALTQNEAWMRAVIAQRVGEQGAVDEVFQDIALAVARETAPLRDPTKLNAWLYRLVVLQSAMYRRKAGRKRRLLKRYEEQVFQTDESRQEPLDWLLDSERRQFVRDALELMPEDERSILLMKYSDDKSYREIADELGTTERAVQSKLHRARRRLKQILTQSSCEEFDSDAE